MTSSSTTGLIDTKLLGKPKQYSGNRSEWASWKFVFRSYIGTISGQLLNRLEQVERLADPVGLNRLTPEEIAESRTLSYILAQTLSGSSLQLLMNVEECNGYEGWRQLVRREEPTAGSAQVGQLAAILKAKFSCRLEYYEDEV